MHSHVSQHTVGNMEWLAQQMHAQPRLAAYRWQHGMAGTAAACKATTRSTPLATWNGWHSRCNRHVILFNTTTYLICVLKELLCTLVNLLRIHVILSKDYIFSKDVVLNLF